MISKDTIVKGLQTKFFGQSVFAFNTIDSTNTFAKSLSKDHAPHGTIIIAEEQTAGRGRLQRNWSAEREKNLLFSLIFYPEFDVQKISLITFAGALAVADAIEATTSLSPSCKWPNDILINGKKVSGMLLETNARKSGIEKVILGIGINVNQSEFPEELVSKATSLINESGKVVDRIQLLQKILEELEYRYLQLSSFPPEQLLNDWRMKALLFGKKIVVLESEFSFTATAIDVNEDGSLIIQMDDGQKRRVFAGDVSLAYT